MATAWRVVGGEDRGGIVVRKGQELSSAAEPARLATGAVVMELELVGDRLRYQLLKGSGPASGWASLRMQGKELLVKAEWPKDTKAPNGSESGASSEAARRQEARAKAEAAEKAAAQALEDKAKKEDEERARREEEDAKAKREKDRREREEKAKQEEEQKAWRQMDAKRSSDFDGRRRIVAEERARRERDAKLSEDRLQQLRAENALKESERAARRTAREGTAGTCSLEVEERFASLERLADQQQLRLERLGDFCARLLQEVSDLHTGHSTLHASHTFLCDCLSGSRLLQAEVSSVVLSKQVRQRGRLGSRLSPIFRLADDRSTTESLWRMLGDQGAGLCRLSQAARPLVALREAVLSLAARGAVGGAGASAPGRPGEAAMAGTAQQFDEAVWASLRRHEPTQSTLEQWERSQTVQAVMGSMRGVEGIVGKTESVRFVDVHTIFAQIGVSLDHFINKFRYTPSSSTSSLNAKALEKTADAILRKFVIQRVDGDDRMSCRDFYRMLELIGYPLQRFKQIFPGAAVVQDNPGDGSYLRIGGITIRRQIGQGFKGARCYLGEQGDGTRVAVKWPAPLDEVVTVKEILKKAPKDCIGIPKLLGSGTYQAKSYLVTELLGSPLSSIFERIHGCSLRQRWFALRIIGRLMIRRLQAFHACGYVHCDISPENVLLGRARGEANSNGPQIAFYLIDFELAQKFPGGCKVEGNIGSAEWSSMRSADVVERMPEDDLEALGWVLLNGLVGALPWFDWLGAAYRDWESKWTRAQAVKQVQRGKQRVLEDSSSAAGWRRSVGMPEELLAYLRLCCSMAEKRGSISYASLSSLLGGDASLSDQEAEKRDLEQFARHVMPLL